MQFYRVGFDYDRSFYRTIYMPSCCCRKRVPHQSILEIENGQQARVIILRRIPIISRRCFIYYLIAGGIYVWKTTAFFRFRLPNSLNIHIYIYISWTTTALGVPLCMASDRNDDHIAGLEVVAPYGRDVRARVYSIYVSRRRIETVARARNSPNKKRIRIVRTDGSTRYFKIKKSRGIFWKHPEDGYLFRSRYHNNETRILGFSSRFL